MNKKLVDKNTSSKIYKKGIWIKVIKTLLVPVVLLFLPISCEQPFNLVESLDGPDGIALTLSPGIAQIDLLGTISMTASGGIPPYTFSISSGGTSGDIDEATGLFSATATPGTVEVLVSDSYGSEETASIDVAAALVSNISYTLSLLNDTSTYHIGGNAISGNFVITNIGSTPGGQPITWRAYISSDNTLNVGDSLIDSNTTGALVNGTSSAPINFSGTWPDNANTYFLIITVFATDAINSALSSAGIGVTDYLTISPVIKDLLIGNSTTFTATGGDLSYTYSAVTGTIDGSGVYTAPAVTGADTVTVTDGLGATADATVNIFDVVTNVNYDTVTVSNTGAVIGVGGGPIAGEFIFTNSGSASGTKPINWEAYVSIDASIGAGDDLIGSGSTLSLNTGQTLAVPITFSGTWPETGNIYNLMVKIWATDDVTIADNTGSSSVTVNDPLTITPVTKDLLINSSTTFSAAGGDLSYTFSAATGTINSATGVYTAPAVAIVDTVTVTDGAGATADAIITVLASELDIDYIVTDLPAAPSTGEINTSIAQSFTITNQGSADGSDPVFWNAYASDNQTLNGDDTPVGSGFILDGVNASTASTFINITDNWPGSGTYYLIVSVSAGDDINNFNNYSVSASFDISAGAIGEPDYVITDISSLFTTVTTGSPVSESFDLHNAGDSNGTSEDVTWTAFASADQTFGSDTPLGSGSTSAVSFGTTAVGIDLSSASWVAPGIWYLFLEVLATTDETIAVSNNTYYTGPFTVYDPPDYSVVFDSLMEKTGQTTQTISGSTSFTITNTTSNNGENPIVWRIFQSTDAALSGDDVQIDTGVESSMLGIDPPVTIPITATWPLGGGYYYLIVTISSDDDANLLNNQDISNLIAVGDEILLESEIPGSNTNDTIATAENLVSLIESGKTAVISGIMDDYTDFDYFGIIPGTGVTELSFQARWNTGFDDIDFYLFDSGGGDPNHPTNEPNSSVETGLDSEPATSSLTIPGLTSPTDYYLGIYFYLGLDLSGSTGQPYTVIITAP